MALYLKGIIMKLLALSFLLSASSALYAGEIKDQSNFMEYFETQLSKQTYLTLHPCQFSADFVDGFESLDISCSPTPFGTFCMNLIQTNDAQFKKNVESCSTQEQVVLSENGQLDVFSETNFNEIKGNYFKKYLENLELKIGHKFNIVIEKFSSAQMTVAANLPDQRKIDVINVSGRLEMIDLPGTSIVFTASVSPEVPGPIQLLRFRLDDTNIYRVLNFEVHHEK